MFAVTSDIRLLGKKALALTGLRRCWSASPRAATQAAAPLRSRKATSRKSPCGLGAYADSGGQGLQKRRPHQCQPGEHRPRQQDLDEFYQDAKKIHALGDNYYITSDTGVAGFYDSMTWLASATLFSTEGETVTINLTGAPKVKARGIFGDYLGKSYTGNQKLSDGVAAWEQALKDYAKDQGYIVK